MSKLTFEALRSSRLGSGVTLHGQIAEFLGRSILSGELSPGEVLPNEAALGASLRVSRTAIREAVKVLTSKGLVEVRRKTGTRVRGQDGWNRLDPDVLAWQFGDAASDPISESILDLLELREVIEPAAAQLAAERADGDDMSRIDAAFAGMEEAIGDAEAAVEADLAFHLAILRASHNVYMLPFGALIQAALRASFRTTNQDRTAYRESLFVHADVLEAIRVRNGELAAEAMRGLLSETRRKLQRALNQRYA
jgi:DNA-binding FadR family transcriptional regulator